MEDCYGLAIPNVPAGVWAEVDRRFGVLKCAERDEPTAAVTTIAESCWTVGTALNF
ncbi:hypothetical protein PC116_g16326 [Phytophthora cactorum]|nr:hypothetical protein PC116_g16326 [Phytophthora cactorum]